MILIASEKDGANIEAFRLQPSLTSQKENSQPLKPELLPLAGAPFHALAEDEVYGACLYQSPTALYVFITDKSGLITQYRLSESDAVWRHEAVRSLRVSTQPEACVVDDRHHRLYVGEEDVGIWQFDARETGASQGLLIATTGEGGTMTADVEGLAIYAPQEVDSEGYLIASSQGDHTYAVYNHLPPYQFLGRFQLSHKGELIGDTDGLEVTAQALGKDYPKGMLVVQDGLFRDAEGNRRNQRFSYVSWADIEEALGLSLINE